MAETHFVCARCGDLRAVDENMIDVTKDDKGRCLCYECQLAEARRSVANGYYTEHTTSEICPTCGCIRVSDPKARAAISLSDPEPCEKCLELEAKSAVEAFICLWEDAGMAEKNRIRRDWLSYKD